MSRTPELSEVFDVAREATAAGIYSAMPGRVERYESARQLVDIQPLVKVTHEDEEGAPVVAALPVIPSVPVAFPAAGGMRLTFPITVGNTGLLVFCSVPLDKWEAHGGLVDPEDSGRHSLADAIFLPGLHDFAHPFLDCPTGKISLGADASPAAIEIASAEIKLGKLAIDAAVRGTTYRTAEDLLFAAFAAAFAALAGDSALTTGKAGCAAVAAAMTAFQLLKPAYLSTLVKVQ